MRMPPLSELVPFATLLITFLGTGYLLKKPITTNESLSRDVQIDGLRSLLAFGVVVWHFFIIRDVIWKNESDWQPPQVSRLMSLTGGWTVYMFFAITAYLFVSKLLKTKEAGTGYWLKLYIGRCFRLIPVCAVATIVLLSIKPTLLQSVTNLTTLRNLLIMATASFYGAFGRIGDVDEHKWEYLCPTGSHWTLSSEWSFYFLLPIAGLAFKPTRNLFWVALSLVMVLLVRHHNLRDLTVGNWPFVPGILVAIIVHKLRNVNFFSSRVFGFIGLFTIAAAPMLGNKLAYMAANTVFLLALVYDNPVTSCLKKSLMTSLGETTYSLYILHGLVQYVTLKWIVTVQIARSMPEWIWWMTCAGEIIVVVVISRFSFEYVEKPGIEAGKQCYRLLSIWINGAGKRLLNWI